MIYFNFKIENPFTDRWNTIFYKSGLILKNKAWEFNAYRTHLLIDVDFHFTRKGDHAGLQLMFGILGYALEFNVYDTRHWDYENNTWYNYG